LNLHYLCYLQSLKIQSYQTILLNLHCLRTLLIQLNLHYLCYLQSLHYLLSLHFQPTLHYLQILLIQLNLHYLLNLHFQPILHCLQILHYLPNQRTLLSPQNLLNQMKTDQKSPIQNLVLVLEVRLSKCLLISVESIQDILLYNCYHIL